MTPEERQFQFDVLIAAGKQLAETFLEDKNFNPQESHSLWRMKEASTWDRFVYSNYYSKYVAFFIPIPAYKVEPSGAYLNFMSAFSSEGEPSFNASQLEECVKDKITNYAEGLLLLEDGTLWSSHAPTSITESPIHKKAKPIDSSSTISKSEFENILNKYRSTSFLGYLSTFWIFSWISPTRSQTMRELKKLLPTIMQSEKKITRDQIATAIQRGDDKDHRLRLFQAAPSTAKNGTSTDEVIDALRTAFKK